MANEAKSITDYPVANTPMANTDTMLAIVGGKLKHVRMWVDDSYIYVVTSNNVVKKVALQSV